MVQLLGMKQLGHPPQIRFDREALIPRVAFTAFDVGWWRVFLTQAQIRQRDRRSIILSGQRTKNGIGLIGCIPGPIDNLTSIVDQPRQFDADNLPPIRRAFLANLLWATPLAARMDQFNPIAVQHREKRGLGQKVKSG